MLNTRLQEKDQERRDRKKLILEKLERLHEVISEYVAAYRKIAADAMRFELTGEFKRGLEPIPLREILMLTGFYVPELKSELKKIQDLCTVFSELLLEWMDAQDVPEQRKKAAGKLILLAGEIAKQCERFQEEVVRISNRYI